MREGLFLCATGAAINENVRRKGGPFTDGRLANYRMPFLVHLMDVL